MATITLNSIVEFIESFVKWQEKNKPFELKVIFEHRYKNGTLFKVERESVTNKINVNQVSTFIWVPKDNSKPYLYVFLDSIESIHVRYLSHRIQILSSDRSCDGDVKINIHLSQYYYLENNHLANSVILKLIHFNNERDYNTCLWNWEIESCRKQILSHRYTDFSQSKARDEKRYALDKFELRFSAPSKLNPILLNKLTEIINPTKEPPKSRMCEILLIGGVLIVLALIYGA